MVWPKTLPGEDPKVLENRKRVVYELCEDANDLTDNPFKIWAFFWPEPIVDGAILPPRTLARGDWRDFPVGIAVDSVRFWVFSKIWIACATHTAVKQCLEQKKSSPEWTTYAIPPEVLGYDPRERVSMGLRDLSACDDGTLTAVFEDKGGVGRIFTATPQFKGGNLIIERKETDNTGQIKTTHGWVREPDDRTASRVHKLPIFCWPTIEGLEKALNAKKP